jgi:hypothetical protein
MRSRDMRIEEVRTDPLSVEQMRDSVPEIIAFLLSAGYAEINVMYGWACEDDKMWQEKSIPTSELSRFIEDAIAENIFKFGWSDLHIEDLQDTLEFKFCHESDIHFSSDHEELVKQVIAQWQRKGLTLYVSPGPRKSALRTEWKRLDPGTTDT